MPVYIAKNVIVQNNEINEVFNQILVMEKPRKLPYADAVGYEHMEVERPRNSDTIGYDLDLSILFPEEDKEVIASYSMELEIEAIISTGIPAYSSIRRLSYAEAVAYQADSAFNLTEFITIHTNFADTEADQDIPRAQIQESSQEQNKKLSNTSASFKSELIKSETILQFARDMWTENFYD